ncbi:hypothetical protein Si071_01429 [Streptococcus infantarius subsp. infantarius]|nr:hypothetical protein [Streptococcus infantarius subsp. infantarius]
MNKQELIDKLKKRLTAPSEIDDTYFNKFYDLAINYAIYFAEQLDEPDKLVVPQFVADWYEENKGDLEYNLYKLCIDFREQKLRADLHGWFNDDNHKCIETLVKMKLFGYEVKKEKLYEVFLKRTGAQLGVCVPHGEYKTKFTKTELQAYDFNVLYAYDVKEVEE